nr:putative GTP diphosphokinase RSH1, chloroplastic [Ipomoea batatas]
MIKVLDLPALPAFTISNEFSLLVELVTLHSEVHVFGLAFEAHDGQKCCSGEPFTIHPVAVAQILGELELDWESIAVGLLHDTVEDTNVVGTTCLS